MEIRFTILNQIASFDDATESAYARLHNFDPSRFMQPFRFLLYVLSFIAGFSGLVLGGGPVMAAVVRGGFNNLFSDEILFRRAVIFLLSLILLILIHFGYRLVGAFDVGLPKKPTAPESEGKRSKE